jgi:hypothetical protein
LRACQKLRRCPPTLADATDAEIQHSQRWTTPTDARIWLPKQVRYRTAPRPELTLSPVSAKLGSCRPPSASPHNTDTCGGTVTALVKKWSAPGGPRTPLPTLEHRSSLASDSSLPPCACLRVVNPLVIGRGFSEGRAPLTATCCPGALSPPGRVADPRGAYCSPVLRREFESFATGPAAAQRMSGYAHRAKESEWTGKPFKQWPNWWQPGE